MGSELKIKVAIADAHQVYRRGLKMALEGRRYLDILWAESNGDGLMQKMQNKPPDVLLMDINIPKSDGLTVIKNLRTNFKDLIIIVLSLYEGDDLVSRAMKMGANAYLAKISNPDEIYEAIITCMNETLYLNVLVQKALYSNPKTSEQLRNYYPKANNLSVEEIKILKLLAGDRTILEISREMFMNIRTIARLRQEMKIKVGVKTVGGLIAYGLRNHLLE